VITQKSSRRRESGLLDDFALQILSEAKNDKTPGCHSERSEESGSTGGEILSAAKDDSPDPSPVRFREAFSPNISL
jgi:hypothetical protein